VWTPVQKRVTITLLYTSPWGKRGKKEGGRGDHGYGSTEKHYFLRSFGPRDPKEKRRKKKGRIKTGVKCS